MKEQEAKGSASEWRAVSLFSGGGGLDLGFKQAGFDILWAIDNNPDAVATYKHNIGGHIVCADITKIDTNDIPDCDIVIGGPPCQSFSLAGNRHTDDARGRLVWAYLDIIRAKRPALFLFENVQGLLSARNGNKAKIIDLLISEFGKLGYQVSYKLINAADYGVPQLRKRVIIVGSLHDVVDFPMPTHNADGTGGLRKYVSVDEAIGDLPMPTDDSPIDHTPPTMSQLDKYIVSHVKPGGNYRDIPSDVGSARIRRLQRDGGHTTCYGRMLPDKPSYTINTYFNRPNVGCNIHYGQDRLITVREALRLQTFPDDYVIVSRSKQGKNLIVGNAVPPRLACALAENLKKHLR